MKPSKEREALLRRSPAKENRLADMDVRLKRAADDVLDKTVDSCAEAARARGVPVERVKAAVRARKGVA